MLEYFCNIAEIYFISMHDCHSFHDIDLRGKIQGFARLKILQNYSVHCYMALEVFNQMVIFMH